MTAFPCLTCTEASAPGAYYCADCLALGRTMRAAADAPAEPAAPAVVDLAREVVHVDCPRCAQRSPAMADVAQVACLHCFAVLDLTEGVVLSAATHPSTP